MMGAWNFQKRFAADVESGRKMTTIRRFRKDGRDPKVGDLQALYTGQRSPACRLLGYGKVVERHIVDFTFDEFSDDGTRSMQCFVDNREIGQPELYDIAVADGFTDDIEMREWFVRNHGGLIEGYLFKWELQRNGAE